MRVILILLISVTILSCNNIKLPTTVSENLLLQKNKNILKDHFMDKVSGNDTDYIKRQRSYIINSLSLEELESDSLIIYETLFLVYLPNISVLFITLN